MILDAPEVVYELPGSYASYFSSREAYKSYKRTRDLLPYALPREMLLDIHVHLLSSSLFHKTTYDATNKTPQAVAMLCWVSWTVAANDCEHFNINSHVLV